LTSESKRIARIQADGILGEFDYEVGYPGDDQERMRLIYAPNGRGKTNFLKAVSAALTPSSEAMQVLLDAPFRRLEIEFRDGASILVEREDELIGKLTAAVRTVEDEPWYEVTIDPVDFGPRFFRRAWEGRPDLTNYARRVQQVSPGSVFIGDDRLAPSPPDDPRESGSNAPSRRRVGSLSRLLETVERMLTQRAVAGLSGEGEQTGIYSQITKTTLTGTTPMLAAAARAALETQIKSILLKGAPLERYGLFSMRQVRDISEQINATRANASKLKNVHTILSPYFDSLETQIVALGKAYTLIDTYVTSVNHFLDRKQLRFSASRGIDLVGRDSTRLDPESLSSGERHLLLLLSRSVLAIDEGPLVIIDEPELSLGIEWQRDLLPELLRCSSPGSVQFLIASHSLQIMNAVSRDDIIQPSEPE